MSGRVPELDAPASRAPAAPSAGERDPRDDAVVLRALGAPPFLEGDVSAGSETELQAAVEGGREEADLPRSIEASAYFDAVRRRAEAGEAPRSAVADLERFLADSGGVWENSWVRFPRSALGAYASAVLERDFLADKGDPSQGARSDLHRFVVKERGEEQVRVPVSYLLKVALADLVDPARTPAVVHRAGERMLAHFLSDNTSPETLSFHLAALRPETGGGRAIARETARRLLLSNLLTMYANARFGLGAAGQRASVYLSPCPPHRQRALNDLIPDAFYRELFMSPCLSGWDRGEQKHRYMHLCHEVLSRSRLSAVRRLREAGIITRNLVVLPNLSNVSLANNGFHLSLGSRALTEARRAGAVTEAEEKRIGDLVIKAVEHFLPLFVGAYSAAPYRLGFADFHPELALGFLPHELEPAHLRMIWRRWKKKAKFKVFGRPVTPFGPAAVDAALAKLCGFKGDFVPDFRLIDYFAALPGTRRSPAFDGRPGNHDRLKRELAEIGIFDARMSFYALYRQREFAQVGFSGFEGRHYSLFENIEEDFGRAADLQTLVTAYAYKRIAAGTLRHADVPDDPFSESERRQVFFGAAIGVPTFFLRRDGPNRFLRDIAARAARTRPSGRYPGNLRVYNDGYRRALAALLREDAADLIERLGMEETMADLEARLADPEERSAAGRLTRGALETLGAKAPLDADAQDFNAAAERYYRTDLRALHMADALRALEADLRAIERDATGEERAALREIVPGRAPSEFLAALRSDLLAETADAEGVARAARLAILAVERDARRHAALLEDRG